MVPYYEQLREGVLEETKKSIKSAMGWASNVVSNTTEREHRQLQRLSKVTEDYIRLGYLLIPASEWNSLGVGGHRRQTGYIRKVAKEMKRPFVFVELHGKAARFNFPTSKKYFPLYATLALMQNNNEATPERPRVVQSTDITSRVIYTVQYHFSVNGNDIFEAWQHEAAHNPEWRKLLGLH